MFFAGAINVATLFFVSLMLLMLRYFRRFDMMLIQRVAAAAFRRAIMRAI